MTTEAETRNPEEAGALRRELRFWEAIALSIAIMAPTAAMALNGTVPAQLVGRAVPLAFIFATVGVIFVSYAFIRLTGHFSHAGSVYAFSGATLGPRAGFFSGWRCSAPTWPSPPRRPRKRACSASRSSRARESGTAPNGWSSRWSRGC
jgi:amino acid transporter